MSKLVLVSSDLILGARIEGATQQCGLTMVTVGGQGPALEASGDDCRAVIIDLRTPGINVAKLVEALRKQGDSSLPIVACGPHVHEQRLDEARRAGCDLVLTRGQLDREAESILQQLADEH